MKTLIRRGRKKLTSQQKQDIRAIAKKKDDEIDFSGIPEVLDWSGAEIGKFYRGKGAQRSVKLASPRSPRGGAAKGRLDPAK